MYANISVQLVILTVVDAKIKELEETLIGSDLF
jgi:hypothetical protein